MEIIIGFLCLVGLACFLLVAVAAFEDGIALQVASILIARTTARVAYRARYQEALAEREREFSLGELRGVAE